ncbi:hypothetical protein S40288_08709 [Stachybotrys chartarum IBT 40288]|nr:hypothetical protein S40288_08709 [Stachybotrys chartarum IBT 40288]
MEFQDTATEDTIIVGGVSEVDDELLIRLDHYQQEQEGDITGRPNFEPVADCGSVFYPFKLEQRHPILSTLPASPVDLFQLFLPISLVESWVHYTNEAPEPARGPGPGSRGNSSYKQQPSQRGKVWSPTSVPEIYIWLAIQIYIGLHRETRLEDYWKVSRTEGHLPSHPIVKYMTFNRFQLLSRRIRISPFSSQPQGPFRPCDEWSDRLQAVSLQLWVPGIDFAVDECMVGFEGRAYEKTTVPSKPTPIGFKVWVVAQQGFFLQWIWHTPRSMPAGIRKLREASQQQGSQRGKKRKAVADTERALNPTQAVVVSLLSRLPGAIYHVFLDNLFSSPHLFRALRQQGIAATGTARVNCGIYQPFVVAKQQDGKGKCWAFNTIKAAPTPEGQVNQIAWKDNALVLLLTTVFTEEEFIRRVRRRPSATAQSRPIRREFGPDPVKELPMLVAADAYNKQMGAVDIGDQLRASEGLDHRNRRGGWRAIAWNFLLEVILVNSFLLQQQAPEPVPQWARYKSQRQWRQRLVDDLIALYGKTGGSRQRFRPGDITMPLSQHNHVNRAKLAVVWAVRGFGQVRYGHRARAAAAGSGSPSGSSMYPARMLGLLP